MRLLLVTGSGGVLLDLLALRPWWQRHDTSWVAVRAADTTVALQGLPVTWERSSIGVWRALRLLRRQRPDLVVSAGERMATPFFLAARLLRVPTIWVESLTRTGPRARVARLAREVLVQRQSRPGVFVGELY
ncbi:glycosyltransferase [Paractinoplanes globisporus]|uniref:Glycosyltransferase n=1 Tax=Paractinoplanes globisporus TaxID=113565 RepID=A0ABW6WBS2_9ACTN|nr:glycosyltransferase [Actinoplanes globisporus]